MAQRLGGTAAKGGFYWNLRKWEMTMMPRQGGLLPGDAAEHYVKVPVLALLVLAPIMGAVYAMFLPFIGFAMLFSVLGRKLMAATRVGASGVAATMGPSWRPGEAYLAGRPKEEAGEPGQAEAADAAKGEDDKK